MSAREPNNRSHLKTPGIVARVDGDTIMSAARLNSVLQPPEIFAHKVACGGIISCIALDANQTAEVLS